MSYPDIIVVGVGRSGTSTVARLLQEHFKVRMAYNWDISPWNDHKGSYEEQKMLGESAALGTKHITPEGWLNRYNVVYTTGGLRGIKQTALSTCTKKQWRTLNPRLVIRTYRPLKPTINSMLKWRKPKDKMYWENFYIFRETCLQCNLDNTTYIFPVVKIDFTNKLTDAFIITLLEPWIERLLHGSV